VSPSGAADRCVAEPVSWLRLERFALGELNGAAASAVRAHVDACPACRFCLEQIRDDRVALPALPALPAPPPRRWAWPRVLLGGGALAAAAAALLLWFVVRGPAGPAAVGDRELPGQRLGLKGGGALVVSLVRDRDGDVAIDPASFAAGDRLKVRVTCDRATRIWADVVVYQVERGRRGASFPFEPAALDCGNLVTLPGAFRLDGRAPAWICLAIGDTAAPDRAALARGTAGRIACVSLRPD